MIEIRCFEEISDLLKRNEVKKAFEILEQYIQKNKDLNDHRDMVISNYAFQNRIDHHFNLGIIDWDKYNISSSQVIARALDLAKIVCQFLEVKEENRVVEKAFPPKSVKKELRPEEQKSQNEGCGNPLIGLFSLLRGNKYQGPGPRKVERPPSREAPQPVPRPEPRPIIDSELLSLSFSKKLGELIEEIDKLPTKEKDPKD